MYAKHKSPAFNKFLISFYILIKVMTQFWYQSYYQNILKGKNFQVKIKLYVRDAGKRQTHFQDLIL